MKPHFNFSDWRCAWCSGPWIKSLPLRPHFRFCSDKCKSRYGEKHRHRDTESYLQSQSHQLPPSDSKYRCALCLYSVGLGLRSISKLTYAPKNIIRRFVIRAGVKRAAVNREVQFKRRFGISKRIHVRKRLSDEIIISFYKGELRACARPESCWRKLGYAKQSRSQQSLESRRREQAKENHRLRHDPVFRAAFYVRKRIRNFIKQRGWRKTASTSKAIGCSPVFLNIHIERQFRDGMTWENHGKLWHIDHIKPLASAKSVKGVMKLAHWTNIQPLLIHENMAKGCKELSQQELPVYA